MALSRSSKVFGSILLVVLAIGAGVVYATLFAPGPLGDAGEVADGEPVTVEIPEGLAASQVADLLVEEGVIRSAFAFKVAARFDERANQLRPGTYELRGGMSTDEILALLAAGPEPAETFRVTIPEGLSVDQTLERLADAGGYDVAALREALDAVALPAWVPVDRLPEEAEVFEGLLFPDTYEFLADAHPQEVLAQLVEQTEAVLDQVTPPEGLERYDVLIIASLIERETRVREEQAVVSSVIHNRLERGMRLQIDATVQYARGEHTDRVLFSDLEIQSLWNTYEVDGLPPTPIAAAGRSAIEAAADPADTAFLYYVVSDLETGAHAFAETKQEHDRNAAEFRRKRREAESGSGSSGSGS